jgi:hypothetical protein
MLTAASRPFAMPKSPENRVHAENAPTVTPVTAHLAKIL